MIPAFVDIGSLWEVLPPGVHDATMDEINERFAYNKRRQALFDGFRAGVRNLARAGCNEAYLDGSFVTNKPEPGDFDVCWDPAGVDPSRLDPTLLDFSDRRKAQKEKYGGEFFPSTVNAGGRVSFLDFFQVDKYSGKTKGIVRVLLPFTPGREDADNDHE
jgi:hypothetical protein